MTNWRNECKNKNLLMDIKIGSFYSLGQACELVLLLLRKPVVFRSELAWIQCYYMITIHMLSRELKTLHGISFLQQKVVNVIIANCLILFEKKLACFVCAIMICVKFINFNILINAQFHINYLN